MPKETTHSGAHTSAAPHELRLSEARLQAILDTAVDGIITIDRRGIVDSFNKAAEEMFGYAVAEVLGRNVSLLMPAPHAALHDGYLESYLTTGKAHIIGIGREVMGRRKDGSTFPMELAVSRVDTRHGPTFMGIVRDITDRKRLEEALVIASENEREIIGQELHDTLSQQLTGISLLAKALEKSLADRYPPLQEEAANMSALAKQAVNITKRLAHGLFPTELQRNGLCAALEELADNMRLLFNQNCTYRGDRVRLRLDRALELNLYRIAQEAVANAIKHAQARQIDVNLDLSGRDLVLTVEDDGRGIPRKQAPGKGMGLVIMRYRAGIINGTLTISSGSRSGTRVQCRVPDWHATILQS